MNDGNRGDGADRSETGRRHLNYARFCERTAIWLAMTHGRYLTAWAIVLHYAALHYIDAYLVGVRGIASYSHIDQDVAIAGDEELCVIGARYIHLRDISEAARYRMRGYSSSEFNEMRHLYFGPIKDETIRLTRRAQVASGADMLSAGATNTHTIQ